MKKHRVVALIVMCLLLAPMLITPARSQAADPAKWTYMVYMAGDGNLEHWLVQDIGKEFGKVGSGNGVNIVLLADRHPGYASQDGNWSDTRYFYMQKGMNGASAQDAGWNDLYPDERNMGDVQTLIDFVNYTKATYPAERYVLVMWGHAWAWRPEQTMWDESTPYVAPPTQPDIWASDGAAAGALDPHELGDALNRGALSPVDIIAYDACDAAVIELLAMWQNHAKYMVASEDDVWWQGYRNDLILSWLKTNNATTDANVYALAVKMGESLKDRTVSVVDLDQVQNLLTALDVFAGELRDGLGTYRAEYDHAYDHTVGMDGDPVNKDLYDLAKEIQAAVGDTAIDTAAGTVMTAVLNAVKYEWHSKEKYKDAEGIGIFWPRYPQDLDLPSPSTYGYDFDYYWDNGTNSPVLEFSQLTQWDDFLNEYVLR